MCVCVLFVGDELAQVVGCPWIMRDSGGSLAQNRWQGDLGLTAVGQDDTGGGRHFTSAGWSLIIKSESSIDLV